MCILSATGKASDTIAAARRTPWYSTVGILDGSRSPQPRLLEEREEFPADAAQGLVLRWFLVVASWLRLVFGSWYLVHVMKNLWRMLCCFHDRDLNYQHLQFSQPVVQ